ncbi:unnamed protein product [Microthlaspi erraticum]|uniref:Uncharacterized protein n=1 Tax=Microthlaspi erraticum TaxID=1685480 RepID=A0A6D2KRM9_9BRAS|nr:unnamed protein product [Microthlaspi erraticum]
MGNGKSFAGYFSFFNGHHHIPNNQLLLLYSEQGGDFSGKLKLVDIGSGGVETDNTETASKENGPLRIIYANTKFDGREILVRYTLVRKVTVGKEVGDQIRNYILADSNPTATIVSREPWSMSGHGPAPALSF